MDEYVLVINGVPHTFLMDAEHAARVGAQPLDTTPQVVAVQLPPNVSDKARRPGRRASRDGQ